MDSLSSKPEDKTSEAHPPKSATISSSLALGGGSKFYQSHGSRLSMGSSFLGWLLRKAAWPLQSWLSGPDNLHKRKSERGLNRWHELTTSSSVTGSLPTREMTAFPKCMWAKNWGRGGGGGGRDVGEKASENSQLTLFGDVIHFCLYHS